MHARSLATITPHTTMGMQAYVDVDPALAMTVSRQSLLEVIDCVPSQVLHITQCAGDAIDEPFALHLPAGQCPGLSQAKRSCY